MEYPKPIGHQTLCIVHTHISNHRHCLSGSTIHKFTPSFLNIPLGFSHRIRNAK